MVPMLARVRDNVTKNAEYHQALADNYQRLINDATGGKKEVKADPKHEYLVKLHSDAAKQLYDILGQVMPTAINQAVDDPHRLRRERAGRFVN